jgi:hypothetical protein
VPVGAVPTAASSLAVGLLGGSYKVFAGTSGGVFLFDEGVSLNNQFLLFGGLVGNVIDVKLSPTFNTAAGIYALTTTGPGASLWVSTGGAFAPTPATIAAAGATAGEIGFSADFNVTSNPVVFVGVNGAAGGVFRTTLGGTGFLLGVSLPIETIDVTGSGVFGGAVTIVAGATNGAVYITSNAGVSGFALTSAAKNLTGGARIAYVAIANDYATSNTVFVLKAAGAANDETAFSVSTDKALNFSQIGLINSSINAIDGTAFASNGDYYMVTSAAVVTPGLGDAFTLTATAAGTVTVTGAVSIAVTTEVLALPTTIAAGVITFGDPGDIVTVTATAAGNVTWTNGTGTATAAETVDTNGLMTVAASGVAFAMDMNSVTTSGNHSLWRNVAGKWDRIQGDKVAGLYAMIAVSPNYATDKGVYYVDANVIWASTNAGVSFTAQSFSAGTVNSFVVLDTNTFVVATAAGIMRTTNNGFVWNSVSTTNAAYLVRSSDGTALAAVTTTGNVFTSTDLGATWKVANSTTAVALAGVSAVTFQNGSNTVLFGTTSTGGIAKLDLAATTVAWGTPVTNAGLTNGVGIASGVAASPVIYALDAAGSLTRLITDASVAENIAAATGVTAATKLSIVPAAGGNTLWAVTATKLYTFKDTIAIAVPNVAVASFTTTTANVTFAAVPGATDYAAFVKAGSAAQKDYFTATTVGTVTVDKTALTVTVSGLASNTTYTVSVFAKTPFTSLVGSKTFSTQPDIVNVPRDLAPAAGATGVAITPGFQWGALTGATSYTVEVSTVPTFATLVGTKQTTTINAFVWTTPALAYNTTYYWRVVAITPTGSSDPTISVFTTMAGPVTQPTGTTQPPVTITQTNVTLTTPAAATPAYIWAIIGIGALLVIVIIVLTVRTRRVV